LYENPFMTVWTYGLEYASLSGSSTSVTDM